MMNPSASFLECSFSLRGPLFLDPINTYLRSRQPHWLLHPISTSCRELPSSTIATAHLPLRTNNNIGLRRGHSHAREGKSPNRGRGERIYPQRAPIAEREREYTVAVAARISAPTNAANNPAYIVRASRIGPLIFTPSYIGDHLQTLIYQTLIYANISEANCIRVTFVTFMSHVCRVDVTSGRRP
eukprot:3469931-Pyramimonas_sp.AAC.1